MRTIIYTFSEWKIEYRQFDFQHFTGHYINAAGVEFYIGIFENHEFLTSSKVQIYRPKKEVPRLSKVA